MPLPATIRQMLTIHEQVRTFGRKRVDSPMVLCTDPQNLTKPAIVL